MGAVDVDGDGIAELLGVELAQDTSASPPTTHYQFRAYTVGSLALEFESVVYDGVFGMSLSDVDGNGSFELVCNQRQQVSPSPVTYDLRCFALDGSAGYQPFYDASYTAGLSDYALFWLYPCEVTGDNVADLYQSEDGVNRIFTGITAAPAGTIPNQGAAGFPALTSNVVRGPVDPNVWGAVDLDLDQQAEILVVEVSLDTTVSPAEHRSQFRAYTAGSLSLEYESPVMNGTLQQWLWDIDGNGDFEVLGRLQTAVGPTTYDVRCFASDHN
jgi:hypothetical protein